jgi:SAM-dependent methyltransferase
MDRLNPPRASRTYYHLVTLRDALQSAVAKYVAGRGLSTLVDLGCGSMPYKRLFQGHIKEYLGLDLRPSSTVQQYADCCDGVPIPDDHADIVLSTQVLEHVKDPGAYLADARRILKPGGTLLLTTHGVWRFHPDPTDYRRWTRDGLVLQIKEAGFHVLECNGLMGPEATALQLLQDARLARIPRWLQPYYVLMMQFRIWLADRRTPPALRDADACTYLVVARKPPEDETAIA